MSKVQIKIREMIRDKTSWGSDFLSLQIIAKPGGYSEMKIYKDLFIIGLWGDCFSRIGYMRTKRHRWGGRNIV